MTTGDHAVPSGALKSYAASVLISSVFVVPFFVIEWMNNRTLLEDFPVVLFVFMSLHALLIVLLLAPSVRRYKAERSLNSLTPGQWAGLLLGCILIVAYAQVVIDQLPCFLGTPNCD